MSPSVRESDDDRIELGASYSRTHIIAGACLLLLPAGVGIIMLIASALTPDAKPEQPIAYRSTIAPDYLPDASTIDDSSVSVRWNPEVLPAPRAIEVIVAKPLTPVGPEKLPAPRIVVNKPTAAPKPIAEVVTTPAYVKPSPSPSAPQLPTFKRRLWNYEEELLEQLLSVKEIDIDSEKDATKKLLGDGKATARPTTVSKAPSPVDHKPFQEQVASRSDLKGLPFRDIEKCQAPADEAFAMQKLSTAERRGAVTRSRTQRASEKSPGQMHAEAYRRDLLMAEHLEKKITGTEWQTEYGQRLMVQMFQIEGLPTRLQLVKNLAASKAKNASTLLAQRAVFDLTPEVRQAAVMELKKRPAGEYRQVLLDALRYPWPPASAFAAEALVALNERGTVDRLFQLLDEPDPQAPFQNKDKKWAVAELVRVNHLGNCALCHAASASTNDPVRGLSPTRGETLPEIYYDRGNGAFVRADVTYIQQDFSVMQPVAEPKKWPAVQRFDYFVRERELTPDEVKRHEANQSAKDAAGSSSPQREAVLWALNELSGYKPGGR